MRIVFLVAALVLALDQASKYWIVQVLNLRERLAIDIWPPFLNLRMAWNRGVNFGLMAGDSPWLRWALIGVALVIVAVVWRWVARAGHGPLARMCAGVLIGGALGNVIDRLHYGAVADFINMSCCGFTNPTAFNIADIAIFAGAIGLVLFSPDKKAA